MNKEILNRIIDWAKKEKDIRTLILIGSLAGKGKVDKLSDFDISVFARSSKKYVNSSKWMSKIGNVWVYEPEKVYIKNKQYPTRLIIFENGIKADFAFYSLKVLKDLAKLKRLPLDYDLGYEILLDKDGLAKSLSRPTYRCPTSEKPTQQDFTYVVNVFFFEVYHVAKHLYRNDLWHAKFRDWATKEFLLQIIEWHEKSKHGWDYDTYDLGKGMQSWTSPSIWKTLHQIFGHFDSKDSWKALLVTINLFSKVAKSTAKKLGYKYPSEVDRNMTAFIKKLQRANK